MKEIEIDTDIPEANHIHTQDHNNINNEKNTIIDNYLPNLSNYQKVLKKIEGNNGTNHFITLSPNVNFTEQKDYYIFYNNNLKRLIDLYEIKLTQYKSEHNIDFISSLCSPILKINYLLNKIFYPEVFK